MKQVYCNELVRKLQLIRLNRCSLSDDDREVIDKVITLLKSLSTQADNDPKAGSESLAKIIDLLLKLFLLGDEITDVIEKMS